jgi:hypothetical protein
MPMSGKQLNPTPSDTSIYQVRESGRYSQAIRTASEVPLIDFGGSKILDLVESGDSQHPA